MLGRKRKQNIKREPNGRAQRERGIEPNAIAQLMPHRRLVPAEVAHDPKAESPIGRLLMNGYVSRRQYNSAIWWRGIVGRYRVLIEAPKADARSIAGVIVGPWGRSGIDPTPDEIADRTRDYNGGFIALNKAGNHILKAVSHWVIHERPDLPIEHLKCGLDALGRHRDLTNQQK
jgi:hypothetical protein